MPKIEVKDENEADDVIVVTESIKIDDGKHSGQIVNIVRNLPNEAENRMYDYLDITIKVNDVKKEPEIKVGFPTNISELSSLGRLLKKAGMSFADGDEITIKDIKSILTNKKVTFLSTNEKTEYGEFAKILRDTIEFA